MARPVVGRSGGRSEEDPHQTPQPEGGKKSLLVNSRNLCKATQRATVRMKAQNGLSRDLRPVLANDCKGKGKKPKRR